MVYECEKCGAALPAGALACPKCGDDFDEAVPQDAKVQKRGWRPKTEADSSFQPSDEATSSAISPETVAKTPEEPYPDYILPNNQDREYWQSKVQQAKSIAGNAVASSYGQKLKQSPLLVATGILILVLVLIATIRPHTSSYVFEQHPLYQANMATLCNPPASSLLGEMGAEVVWPYEDHEDRLHCNLRSNGSSGIGSNPSAALTKAEIDQEAILIRAIFCGIRYRSGFTSDDAMKCQVYVSFDGSSDTGYDGPDVAPDRDAAVKGRLDQVQ